MRAIWVLTGVSLGSLGRVDCFPLRDCLICPFAVASDFVRNFRMSCSVSPGHLEKKLFLIAVIIVDVHGLQHAIWKKCSGQLLILPRIKYRQNDVQEFCIPSYLHFVRVLEVPYTELIYCRVFHA